MIVQDRLTPLAPEQAAAALATAYRELTGTTPTPAVLALLVAQSALETGHWQSIHNFNFGNQKAHASYPMIVQFRCSEIVDGVERFFDPPDPHCRFRAYDNAAAGALDYVKVLRSREHWWQGLHTGDPIAFVNALATPPKYFTANPERYKRTLVSLVRKYGPLAASTLHRASPPSTHNGAVASNSVSLPSALPPPFSSVENADSGARKADDRALAVPSEVTAVEHIETAKPAGLLVLLRDFLVRFVRTVLGRIRSMLP